MARLTEKETAVQKIKKLLHDIQLEPEEINGYLLSLDSSPISEKQRAEKILLRPNIGLAELIDNVPKLAEQLSSFNNEALEQSAIQIKYDTYIQKERDLVNRMSQLENLEIPDSFDYFKIPALGNEAREKLLRVKPRTLGQASRISGINPSDVQILMVYMGR